MQGDDHPAKRALRERRERVVDRLADGFARDEIGLEVFERRLEAAYRCATEADLDALVADLPRADDAMSAAGSPTALVVAEAVEIVPAAASTALAAAASTALAVAAPRPVIRAIFSNIERRDHVVVADGMRVEAVFGNVEIDLRDARFVPGVTEVHVRAVFGNVEITVPADVTVEVHGAGIFGNFEGSTRSMADPDAPVLRIVGSAVFASAVVRTAPPLRVERRIAEVRARKLLPR
jgi:Cell wall-active antibiotics response 4TMS YvqF/Domain of unknown function (DUF1707)